MTASRAGTIAAGALLIGLLAVGGGAALYYAWLPDNPGPDNASPPPEAFGLMLGILLGCVLGVGAIALFRRSVDLALQSFAVVLCAGSLFWLVFGSGAVSGRVVDCLLVAVVCSVAAGVGVVAGLGGAEIVDTARRRRTKPI